MKINKIHINGFGKFVNTDIVFKDGFNLVFGKNEAGKSTLQSFIKAMLFGFPRKNKDGEGRLPGSKKYLPWDGVGFSGNMEIELNSGQFLKIERDFSQKSTSVYNKNLKEITSDFPFVKKDGLLVGESLLNMDRECFENTAFIKQGGTIVLQNDRKNLFEKLMNLSQTGSENTSAVSARDAISKAVTALGNPRTKNRPFNNASKEFSYYSSILDAAIHKRDEMAGYREKQLVLDEEIQILSKKIKKQESLSAARKLFDEKSKLEAIKKRYDDITADIESLSREIFTAGTLADKNKLPESITEKDILEYIRRSATANEKQKSIPHGDPEIKYAKLSTAKLRKKIFLVLCYAGITLTSLLALLFHPVIFTATAILTILLAVIHLKKKPYTEEQVVNQLNLTRECNEELVMVNAFLESAGRKKVSSFEEAEPALADLFDFANSSVDLKNQISVKQARKSDLEKFRKDIIGKHENIGKVEELLDNISEQIKLTGITVYDSNPLSGEATLTEYEEKQRELAGIKMLLREYLQSDEEIAEIKESIELHKNKLENLQMEIKALNIASDAILKAAEMMQEDIIPRINEKTGLILGQITGGKYNRLLASRDQEMNTEHQNTVRSLWEFSDGTIDQMYFALRIASSEVFSEKESVPILIDEAFAYYDEERIKSTFIFLSEISKDKQIILFTCKEREVELVSELENVNIVHL